MKHFKGTLNGKPAEGIISDEYAAKLEPSGRCLNCGEYFSSEKKGGK